MIDIIEILRESEVTRGVADSLIIPDPGVRTFKNLEEVYPTLEGVSPEDTAYLMYRDVSTEKDENLFKLSDIRYDITVILPHQVGKEYTKTLGHYHPFKDNSIDTYPEVYQVIKGEATYILQSFIHDSIEVKVIKAKEGDIVIIPPNYGHITINPSDELLVMANLVERNFKSEYESIIDHNGGVLTYEGTNLVLNPQYKYTEVSISFTDSNTKNKTNIYKSFVDSPDDFKFLI